MRQATGRNHTTGSSTDAVPRSSVDVEPRSSTDAAPRSSTDAAPRSLTDAALGKQARKRRLTNRP
eukprot:5531303-Prorocentrum_lima.AAC.1